MVGKILNDVFVVGEIEVGVLGDPSHELLIDASPYKVHSDSAKVVGGD